MKEPASSFEGEEYVTYAKIGRALVVALASLGIPLAAHVVVLKSQSGVSQTGPSVIALNQKLKNDQVVITYAYLPADGYLVIYGSDKNGNRSGKPLGRIC